ncbi:REP element-mobilizing transposase RayT [Mesobacillus persicus]|uniref:REP element-mobilizing transposase RayT n=1 Tax=Mesobacillus persicus TaxID=930146 RepID=A0A1H8K911_9BACI|nr:transposase [Mesobacillus persicus]SEN89335.1 REP element-mobilizing transposase RayT [Mesobacillus persicus]
MGRVKRTFIPNQFYHVVCRGNRRDPLFRNTTDFQAFLHILQQLHEKYPFEIASYCLMTNHFHLQIRSEEVPLSKIMSLMNKRYANYYNTKYRITGHVFEKRFYDKLIDDKEGMLEVSRYIHLNPVAARMVKQPEYYPWSSYYLYRYPQSIPPSFLNVNRLLDYYEGSMGEKREKYCGSLSSQ